MQSPSSRGALVRKSQSSLTITGFVALHWYSRALTAALQQPQHQNSSIKTERVYFCALQPLRKIDALITPLITSGVFFVIYIRLERFFTMSIITTTSSLSSLSSLSSVSSSYSIWVSAPKAVGIHALNNGLAPAGGYDRKRRPKVKASGTLKYRWSLEDRVLRPAHALTKSPLYGAFTNRPEQSSLDYYGRGNGRVCLKINLEAVLPWTTCTKGDSYSQGRKAEPLPLAAVKLELKRAGNPWFYSDRCDNGRMPGLETLNRELWRLQQRLDSLRQHITKEQYELLLEEEEQRLIQEWEKERKRKWWEGTLPYIEVQIWREVTPSMIEDWIIFD